jgi:hypothetical protein
MKPGNHPPAHPAHKPIYVPPLSEKAHAQRLKMAKSHFQRNGNVSECLGPYGESHAANRQHNLLLRLSTSAPRGRIPPMRQPHRFHEGFLRRFYRNTVRATDFNRDSRERRSNEPRQVIRSPQAVLEARSRVRNPKGIFHAKGIARRENPIEVCAATLSSTPPRSVAPRNSSSFTSQLLNI